MTSAADQTIRLGRTLDVEASHLRTLTAAAEQTEGTTPLLRERLAEARLGNLASLSTGWAAWAVGVTASRLRLVGFTTDGTERPDLATTWRTSVPESDEALFLASALLLGRGYLLTWTDADGSPRITVESPFEVAHEVDPATGETVRALKRWTDIEGESRALLFERDRLTWMRSGQKAPANLYAPDHLPMPTAVSTWTTTATEPNPLQRCPISAVALRRSPRDTVGRSDLAPLLPIQAALDKAVVDAMTLSEAAAAPRRWATGVEIPTDPDTGATVDPFTSAAGTAPSITIAEDPAARLGSFPAADLSGTLATIEALRSDLLARAAVPPHLAVGAASGQMVSAESIRSAEASLVTRVRDRQRLLGDGIGRAVRLASEVATGRPEAFVVPTWADPATSTVAADADAAVKLLGAGIPPAAVLSAVLGWTPDQVAAATSAPTDERPV